MKQNNGSHDFASAIWILFGINLSVLLFALSIIPNSLFALSFKLSRVNALTANCSFRELLAASRQSDVLAFSLNCDKVSKFLTIKLMFSFTTLTALMTWSGYTENFELCMGKDHSQRGTLV